MNNFTRAGLRLDGLLSDETRIPTREHLQGARNMLIEAGRLQDEMHAAIDAAINWFTPPNDSKTKFPLKQLSDAASKATANQ